MSDSRSVSPDSDSPDPTIQRSGTSGSETTHTHDERIASVQHHYESMLAHHYAWMCGEHDERVEQAFAFLDALSLDHSGSGQPRALDLGCGTGIQSCALARLGYDVTAVDFSESLLEQLIDNTEGLSVHPLCHDITRLDEDGVLEGRFDLIVCMGDTLTHLPSRDHVDSLLENLVTNRLNDGGAMVLGYRDLSHALQDTDRVIPVRMEPDQVMLAFLEYGDVHVRVNDLILTREASGWSLEKSAYPKLRIAEQQVRRKMESLGLNITMASTDRGMCHLVGERHRD